MSRNDKPIWLQKTGKKSGNIRELFTMNLVISLLLNSEKNFSNLYFSIKILQNGSEPVSGNKKFHIKETPKNKHPHQSFHKLIEALNIVRYG